MARRPLLYGFSLLVVVCVANCTLPQSAPDSFTTPIPVTLTFTRTPFASPTRQPTASDTPQPAPTSTARPARTPQPAPTATATSASSPLRAFPFRVAWQPYEPDCPQALLAQLPTFAEADFSFDARGALVVTHAQGTLTADNYGDFFALDITTETAFITLEFEIAASGPIGFWRVTDGERECYGAIQIEQS